MSTAPPKPQSAADQRERPLFATERNPRLRLIIPTVVAVAFLMEQLDSTIVTTAIPDIAQSLGTTALRLNLAVTTYVLTLAVFIPVSGWFADRFGARRVFVSALVVFTAGSALCGVANSLLMLLAMRVLQGMGGAMMTPVGRLILLRSFPRDQFFTAMVYMSVPALMGPVLGPLLGGFITTYISWRWIFYINIPFGLVGVLMALRFLDPLRSEAVARFDFGGFLLVGSGLALLQYGIENVGRPTIPRAAVASVLAAAVLLLLAFVRHAGRRSAPVVDLSLLRMRSFRIGALAGGLSRIGMNGVPFLVPLMLQVGFGMSPAQSGSLTFCSSFGALLIRPISARLLRLLGFDRLLLWGSALSAASVAGFALFQADTSPWLMAGYLAVFGLIRSTLFMSSNTLSYSDIPAEKLSRATSLGGVLQQLTVSFGVSISAMLLGLLSWHGQPLTPGQFHAVFLLMAAIPLLALPGFLGLRPEDGMEVSGHRRRAHS